MPIRSVSIARRYLITLAILAVTRTAFAQTVSTDDDNVAPPPRAAKLEAPFRTPDPRPPLGPLPAAPRSTAPATFAGGFLGAVWGGLAGLALAQHEIAQKEAHNSDSLNGPDAAYITLGYGISGVVFGALIGAVTGHGLGQKSF